MTNLKRIVSGVITAGIITAGSIGFAYDPFERLEKYEIMKKSEDATAYVTRIEMTKIIAPAFTYKPEHIEKEIVREDIFSDVKDHEDNKYISFAMNKKIINGYPDGTFKPDNNVTYGEAIKIILCMLGYEPLAESMMLSYPDNYIELSKQLGFAEKVDLQPGDYVTQGQMATLVDFSLDLPLMEQATYGSDINYRIAEDKSIFKTYLSE